MNEFLAQFFIWSSSVIMAILVLWAAYDVNKNKESLDLLKRILKKTNRLKISKTDDLKELEKLFEKLLTSTIDQNSKVAIKPYQIALYMNSGLFRTLIATTEKIKSSNSRNKKSNTIVGMMISKKIRASSKAQAMLVFCILIHLLFSSIFSLPVSGLIFTIVSFSLFFIHLDNKIIEYRISKGIYGRNDYEAKEIINFILSHSNKNDFNNSGGLKRVIPHPKTYKEVSNTSPIQGRTT